MNCLHSRRLLLARPRERTAEHREHIRLCTGCARYARRLIGLEHELEDTIYVAVPYAVAERVLVRTRRGRRGRRVAAAIGAMVFAAVGVGAHIADATRVITTVHAVGPAHPAVAAIAEVEHHIGAPNRIEPPPSEDVEASFRRLGLPVPQGEAHVSDAGRCSIGGTGECRRITLTTADEQASVMLVPLYPAVDRVLVSERRMVAIMGPARNGAYIVVAASADVAKRMEKLLVNG